MKILVLAEGSTPEERVRGEWGLSLLVDEKILFDTFGSAEKLEKNVKSLGVDLSKLEAVVISHLHWDHISGLGYVLENAGRPALFLPEKSIEVRALLDKFGVVPEVGGLSGPGFALTPPITIKYRKEDLIEQAMIVKGTYGPALIAGCSHPGIDKLASAAQTGIKTVFGGFHLKDADEVKVRKTVESLKKAGVERVFAGHCTGDLAFGVFMEIFGDRYVRIQQGVTYNI